MVTVSLDQAIFAILHPVDLHVPRVKHVVRIIAVGDYKTNGTTGVLSVIIQKVDWAQCTITADCANLHVETPVECRNNECRYTWDRSE